MRKALFPTSVDQKTQNTKKAILAFLIGGRENAHSTTRPPSPPERVAIAPQPLLRGKPRWDPPLARGQADHGAYSKRRADATNVQFCNVCGEPKRQVPADKFMDRSVSPTCKKGRKGTSPGEPSLSSVTGIAHQPLAAERCPPLVCDKRFPQQVISMQHTLQLQDWGQGLWPIFHYVVQHSRGYLVKNRPSAISASPH